MLVGITYFKDDVVRASLWKDISTWYFYASNDDRIIWAYIIDEDGEILQKYKRGNRK